MRSSTSLPSVFNISIVSVLITILKSSAVFHEIESKHHILCSIAFLSLPGSDFSKLIMQLNANLTGSGFCCFDVDVTVDAIFCDETKVA